MLEISLLKVNLLVKYMKINTLVGILLGLLAIFGAYFLEGGKHEALFMLSPLIIVVGGTLSAGLAGTSLSVFAKIPKLIAIAFNPPEENKMQLINQITEFSKKSRKEGILALEGEIKRVDNPFMRKLLRICIDGADQEVFDQIVESEISHLEKRHNEGIELFSKLGGYSPTMGIIGTVMGLILTLSQVGSDPNELIKNIATAFIATMWGIILANILWLPISDKLRKVHNDEMEIIQLIVDGIRGIHSGDNPSSIKSKLMSIFPIPEQEQSLQFITNTETNTQK